MINFLQVEKSVEILKKELAAGRLDEQTFESHLLNLIDVAEDGYYWMLGHESGRWYRHDGGKWVPNQPGEMFVPLKEIAPEESIAAKWRSVKPIWLAVSLLVLVAIGVIVYYSAL